MVSGDKKTRVRLLKNIRRVNDLKFLKTHIVVYNFRFLALIEPNSTKKTKAEMRTKPEKKMKSPR